MRTIKSGIYGLILLVVAASALFLTCDVGLGDSVDTKPPTVAITYPPVQSVIKNSFTMTGSASDDTSLSAVNVGVVNTVTATVYGPFAATIDPKTNAWSLVVNKRSDAGFELRDGTYEMTVTAVDAAGRKTVATTTYEIDNTAPVVVIERPGTYGQGSAPEVYGTELKVTGSINDDHAIDKLVFTAYEYPSGAQIGSPITQTNISGVAMDVTIAKSFKAPSNNEEVALNALYTALHSKPDANGTQYYYCTITASDTAREYNPPAAVASADNTRGNVNSVYYVYDDVYSTIFAATGYAVTMKDLTAMFNGSYADAAKSAAVLKALAAMARPAATWSASSATFSLNPNNSPTYELKGFAEIADKNPIGGMKKTNATDLTILVSAGRDGVPLVPDTFRVSLDPCGPAGDTPLDPSDSDNIVLLQTVAELGSDAAAITTRNAKCTKTGTDYSIFVNIGTRETKKNYLLRVSGSDQNGNPLEEKKYGFRVITSGKPPVITFIGSTPANLATVNSTSVTVEGTVVSETGLTSMPGTVSIRRTSNSASVDNTSPPDHANPTGLEGATSANWSMPIDTGLYTDEADSFEYTVTMTATDEENSTVATRIFYVDRVKPQVEFTSVSPTVRVGLTDYVNGIVILKGRVTDNDKVESATYSINGSFPQKLDNFTNWSLDVDTRDYDDPATGKGTLTLTIATTDRAGNTNTATKAIAIDQDTDKPIITLTNADTSKKLESDVSATVNLFGKTSNNKLLGTITDDDKLGTTMQVLVDGAPADPITIDSPGTTYSLYYTPTISKVPLSEGTHRIEIIASDNGVATSTTGTFWIGIDEGDPSLAITEPAQNEFYTGTITVKGTASDASGVVTLVRQPVIPPITDTPVTVTAGAWTDSFSVAGTGTHSWKYVATDKYGRTSSATFTYQVDTDPPDVTITTPSSYVKKENVFQIVGTSSDVGSSVSAVMYKVQKATDTAPTAVDGTWLTAMETSPWTASVNLSDASKTAGDYTVYVASKDRAGNYSGIKNVTMHVDGDEPVISALTPLAPYVTGTISFSVKATDASPVTLSYTRTGLGSPVTATDPANFPIGETVSADGTYVYTFTATDSAGHKSTYTASTVYDKTVPKIEISSVTKQITANGRDDNVNGEITVKGTISDNDKVDAGTYTLSLGDKDDPSTFADVAGFVNQPVGANLTSWTFPIDTTALDDKKDLRIVINAKDRAGNNAAPVTQIVHIDQSTDTPIVTMTNVDVTKTQASDVKESVNLFDTTGNNKLLGMLADDDGLKSYQVIVKDHLGVTKPGADVSLSGSPTTFSLSYTLPTDEDVYSITITTTDSTTAGKVAVKGPFYVGVDAGAPSLAITEPAQNEYYNANISVKGNASDGSGVVTLVRNEPSVTGVAVDSGTHQWANSIDVSSETGYQKKTYVAKDRYGRTTTATFEYNVDRTPPGVSITTPESWFKKENVFQVEGAANDTGSSVSAVMYKVQKSTDVAPTVVDGTWAAAVGKDQWTASINLSASTYAEGTYSVYVASKDRAGNYSGLSRVDIHADVSKPSLTVTPPAAYVKDASVSFTVNASDTNFKSVSYTRTGFTDPVTIATAAGSNTVADTLSGDGSYDYTFTATDLAGRTEAFSCTVVRDSAVPTIEISSVTKQITANGRSDNVNGKITVKGTISDNDKVAAGTYTLSLGDKAVPASFVDVAGFVNQAVGANLTSWAFTVDTTAASFAGTNDLKIVINGKDRAGNGAAPVTQFVHIDQSTDNPIIALTAPVANAYIDGNVVVRGTISDDDGVDPTKLEIQYHDGSAWSGWTRIDATGTVTGSTTDKSFTYPLPALGADGVKQVQVRGSDDGTKKESLPAKTIEAPAVPFSIDTTDPAIAISSPTSDDVAHKSTFQVSGTVTEVGLESLKVSVDGLGKTTLTPSVIDPGAPSVKSWYYDLPAFAGYAQGRHVVTLEAVDKVGRSSSAQRSFYVDTEGPTITFSNLAKVAASAPAPAILTPDSIRGTVSDKYSALGDKFTYRFDSDPDGTWREGDVLSATWTVPIPTELAEGERKIIVKCRDALLNESTSEELRFRLDRDVPTIEFTPPTKTLYNNDFNVSGKNSDANGIEKVEFYVDEVMKTTLTATIHPQTWGYTVRCKTDSQGPGNHTLKIVATDKAGRTSQTVFNYAVDNVAPVAKIEGISPLADGTKINGIVTIAVSATDANGVDGYAYATTLTSVNDPADITAWTPFAANSATIDFDTTADPTWDDKPRRIWVRAADKAGNLGYDRQDRDIDQDTDRPLVKLSNISGGATDISKFPYPTTLKNSNVLYGTVTDDDGVTSIEIKNALGEAWKVTTLDGSAWEYTATGNDGGKDLYFRIVDKSRRVYETSAAVPVATLNPDLTPLATGRPRIQRAGTDPNETVKHLDTVAAVDFNVDTVTPEIGATISADRATPFDFASDANTVPITTNLGFGGTSATFKIRVQSTDANGIKDVTLKIEGASGTSTSAGFSKAWSGAAIPASAIVKDGVYRVVTIADDTDFVNDYGASGNAVGTVFQAARAGIAGDTATVQMEVYDSGDISISGIADGSAVATITVEDNSGLKSMATRTIIVDKKAPDVFYANPKPLVDQLNGDVTVTGSASDAGSGLSSIKYQTGLCADLDPASPKWASAAGTFSWKIDYKAGGIGKIDDFIGPTVALNATTNTFSTLSAHGFADGTKVYFGGAGSLPTVGGASLDCAVPYYVLPDSDADPKTFQVATTAGGPAVAFIGLADDLVVSKYAKDANNDGIWELPIVMRGEDVVGNVSVWGFTDYVLRVDPSGDKPKVSVVYPSNGQTLGGIIRIFGTAVDDDAVASVYMQIDANGDDKYDSLDDKYGSSTVKWYNDGNGQKVSGTASWNQAINEAQEFNPSGSTTRTIHFRVRAEDNNTPGVLGAWSDSREIKIDKALPKIGSSSPLKLVQYNSDFSAITASQPYVDGMYIKGTWYLVGSIEDESGIASVTVSESLAGTLATDGGASGKWFTPADYAYDSDTKEYKMHGYEMRIPLTTSGSGTYTIAIDTTDKSTPYGTNQRTLTIKYDNDGPALANYALGPIVQSNYVYTIASSLTDGNSGLDKVAFYFERNVSGAERVYNVMETRTGDKNRTFLSSLKTVEDLPCLQLSAYTLSADMRSLTSADLKSTNTNVRVGGLVHVGGMFRRITDLSQTATNGTITWADAATDTGSAYVAYAMVVDNLNQESVEYNADNTIKKIKNDDFDGMPESIVKTGTTYAWDATFNSKNIPDGPIELHIVAFDKAGNTSVKVVTTSVQNNRPRIASVILGTDLNGDNDTDEVGETVTYSALDGAGEAQAEVEIQSAAFIAKGRTSVLPTILGGNKALQYTLKVGSNAIYSLSSLRPNETAPCDKIEVTEAKLKELKQDGNGAPIPGVYLIGEGDKKFVIKIWDSTEEMSPGADDATSSQYAILTVPLKVNVLDGEAPKAVVQPFFWRGMGAGNNSLYQGLLANGHIEIPGGTDKPAASGIVTVRGTAFDNQRVEAIYLRIDDATYADSRASMTGMTDLTGTYPSSKTFTVSGTPYPYILVATCIKGAWKGDDRLSSDGWKFAASTTSLTQVGHSVAWTLDWDTSKIDNVADSGQNVKIVCLDRNPNQSDPSSEEKGTEIGEPGMVVGETYVITVAESDSPTTPVMSVGASAKTVGTVFVATGVGNGNAKLKRYAHKPSYTVDVVPYVVRLDTTLSKLRKSNPSVFNRTALGRYPVSSGEAVTICGFNLKGAKAITASSPAPQPGTVSTSDYARSGTYDTVKLPITTLSSGYLTVTVNGVNSRNNNDASAAEYNKLANGDNNNLLTDDVELDVWEINKTAAVPRQDNNVITEPVMKVNPKNDMIGFAFANGVDTFSMPGTNATDNTKRDSYQTWQQNYDDYAGVTFAYDDNGQAHGIVIGRDLQTTDLFAGRMNYLTSKWGRSTGYAGSGDNFHSELKIRLESVGMPKGAPMNGGTVGTAILDKTRFRSPSIAVATHASDEGVYLAYYDNMNAQVRFRAGSNATSTRPTDPYKIGATTYADVRYFGQFVDNLGYYQTGYGGGDVKYYSGNIGYASDADYGGHRVFESLPESYSLIAGEENDKSSNTGNGVGEYVAIDVIPGTTMDTDVVVIVWYDGSDLKYVYRSGKKGDINASTVAVSDTDKGSWSEPITIFSGMGKYCAIRADKKEGVHIAAYDGLNGDLKYAYLSKYNVGSAQTCTVDAYGIVGENISIDAPLNSDDNAVPYISYYMTSTAKPKVAYLIDPAANNRAPDGVNTADDSYTGKWEISLVPTDSSVRADRVNVGLWRDSSGKIKNSATGSTSSGKPFGTCWGNGTSNPVLGYATISGTTGRIETAQKK